MSVSRLIESASFKNKNILLLVESPNRKLTPHTDTLRVIRERRHSRHHHRGGSQTEDKAQATPDYQNKTGNLPGRHTFITKGPDITEDEG